MSDLGFKFFPIEFDIVPIQKLLELMSYNIPTNISNWKKGRDYEKLRTINENVNNHLPYEVVINSNPARAYLMNNNSLAVQILVISHVIGHSVFFAENVYFKNSRKDIIEFMANAQKRFMSYEARYGLDIVEKTIDAGHSLQLHSLPGKKRARRLETALTGNTFTHFLSRQR